MKKYLVYTLLLDTRHFIGLFDTKKEAEEVAKQHEDAKIEIYKE